MTLIEKLAAVDRAIVIARECQLSNILKELTRARAQRMGETPMVSNDWVNKTATREQRLEDALRALVAKVDAVFVSDGYKAVFAVADAHGVIYHGPNVHDELVAAKRLLAEKDGSHGTP